MLPLKHIAKKGVKYISSTLVKLHILPEMYVIKMDGGICSQMHFYLIGTVLSHSTGVTVKYDTDWFRTDGMDCDNRFSRNFDILKMFPSLPIDIISNGLIKKIYISSFYHKNEYFAETCNPTGWLTIKSPKYFDGYFRDFDELYTLELRKIFKVDVSVLPEDNSAIASDIEHQNISGDTCAVHIRRGDLSVYRPGYGNPTSTEYFVDNIKTISREHPSTKFYLFSDEPSWVRTELLPKLTEEEIMICDINGSDRGYSDLILMSRCHHIIASQGSMGKYAGLLREEKHLDGEVKIPEGENSEEWERRFATLKHQRNVKK